MARRARAEPSDLELLSKDLVDRFRDVPWHLFDSKDLGASGETRFMVSRIQDDLMKVADKDPIRAGRIWDEHVPDFVARPNELPPPERAEAPANSIEPGVSRRRRAPAEAYLEPAIRSKEARQRSTVPAQEATTEVSSGVHIRTEPARDLGNQQKSAPSSERTKLLLEGLEKQYLRADDRYHFRDRAQEVAFEAQDKKLVTRLDSPAVIGSMIDLAEAKGWSSLKLNGSAAFRREAWLQASLRDVSVSGYKPTKLDKVRLEELQAAREPEGTVNVMFRQDGSPSVDRGFAEFPQDGKPERRVPLTPPQDQFVAVMEATMRERGDSPKAIAKAREMATDRLTSERLHVGKLIESGSGPYQDKIGEKPSHFVTLENDKGQRSKVWGVDLPRALEESGARPGQLVAVAFEGRKPVEVDVAVKDQGGATVRHERQTVERNSWNILQLDRLREDAKAAVLQKAVPVEPPMLRVFDRAAREMLPQTPSHHSRRPHREPSR